MSELLRGPLDEKSNVQILHIPQYDKPPLADAKPALLPTARK